MKAVWYERNGPAHEVLQFGDMPDPEPAPGEVRVRLCASGVNPSDWKTRSGSRPMQFARVIPHSDGAGMIDRIGPGVDPGRLGERVWTWNGQWKRAFGTAAELIALASQQAVKLPDEVSFEVGACLGIPALTAHRAVTIDGAPAGQSVLVTGGAGAVGFYAIQFAKLLGAAQVLATVSSQEKADCALAAGADAIIFYRTESVVDRVKSLTSGRGVDRVVEVDLAGNASILPHILARNGLCVAYGSNARQASFEFGPMIMSGAAVRFFVVYELTDSARNKAIADLLLWLERNQIQHHLAAVLPLSRTAEAHEWLEQGRAIGNVIVEP